MTETGPSEDIRRQTAGLTAAAAALGEMTSLLIRSPEHSSYKIADLEWMLVPAILNRQYLIVRSQINQDTVALPGACLLWASVSDDIDAQYRANPGQRLMLDAAQRRSGDNVWITDLVGNRRMLASTIDKLRSEAFAGRRMSHFSLSESAPASIIDIMPTA